MHAASSPTSGKPGPVRLEFRGGILVARVERASLDSSAAPRVDETIAQAIEDVGRKLRGLVLDLEAVEFMNSCGLATCIDVAKRASAAGASVAACGLSADIERMFTLMRVDRLLPTHGDRAKAVGAVRS